MTAASDTNAGTLGEVVAVAHDRYTISYRNDSGIEEIVEGDSLESLAAQLEVLGYAGSSIRVTDEPGFTVGWVSAGYWRAS